MLQVGRSPVRRDFVLQHAVGDRPAILAGLCHVGVRPDHVSLPTPAPTITTGLPYVWLPFAFDGGNTG